MMLRLVIILLLSLATIITGVEIANGVIGLPKVQCGVDSIMVDFDTQATFYGKVFVKGHAADPRCQVGASLTRSVSIEISHTSCNTVRSRSLNPPGIQIRNRVIISFHRAFLTKVDRAYSITCFYMEATKGVNAEIEVSPQAEEAITQNVVMPVCKYEVLRGGPNGPPVKYAKIGEPVYHKWSCESDTPDVFCMLVHSCQVRDTSGEMRHMLVDESGCSVDRYLLQHIQYSTELMAGREAHVFKFADTAAVFFECQISLVVREDSSQACPVPQCPQLPFQGEGEFVRNNNIQTQLGVRNPQGNYGQRSNGFGFRASRPDPRVQSRSSRNGFSPRNPPAPRSSLMPRGNEIETGGVATKSHSDSIVVHPTKFPEPKAFEDKPGVLFEVDPPPPVRIFRGSNKAHRYRRSSSRHAQGQDVSNGSKSLISSFRSKRDIATWLREQLEEGSIQHAQTLDTVSREINVLDIEDDTSELPEGECVEYSRGRIASNKGRNEVFVQVERAGPGTVCISTAAFIIVISSTLLVAISTVILIIIALYRNSFLDILSRNRNRESS